MSLQPIVSVRKLQAALHAKAERAPSYRFYALYDKVYRLDVLGFAYACCFENQGAAGVDGQTFEDIEEYGQERWLDELAEAYRKVIAHACYRLRQWLVKKFGVQGSKWSRYSDRYLHETLGLLRLKRQPHPPS